jgi:HemY protein
MNRLLYVLLISAITIIGFSMYQQNDLGNISFSFAAFSFSTNLVVLIAAILCGLFVTSLLIKSYQAIKKGFIYFGSKRQQRLRDKARLSISRGLIEYAEGRFEQSEKILLQHIKYNSNRLLVYLTAARAAQQLGAHDRRDEYLRLAHAETPNADLAISLTKAELQLAHNQNEQALATLTQLNKLSENHTYVLTLLANTYRHLHDWDNLKEILTPLKKHSNLSDESFLSFEVDVCNGQLSNLTKSVTQHKAHNQSLVSFWEETASHLKVIPEVIEYYAKQLILTDAAGEAENVLRLYLNKNWVESTVVLYAELDVLIESDQLEMVESWLKDHQNNAHLLLALGKSCISHSLWGKARSYLEASIAITPMPENYLKLARLLEEHMNDQDAAQKYYRQGLHLLAGDCAVDTEIKIKLDTEHETPQLKIVRS